MTPARAIPPRSRDNQSGIRASPEPKIEGRGVMLWRKMSMFGGAVCFCVPSFFLGGSVYVCYHANLYARV